MKALPPELYIYIYVHTHTYTTHTYTTEEGRSHKKLNQHMDL